MREAEPTVRIMRVNFPLTIVVSVLVAAGSAWGVAQVARAKLDDTIATVADLKAKELPHAVEVQHTNDRLDWLEKNAESQNRTLDRIERKLDRH